ncbi:uncharacterized protein METZ01_LOCUS472439, partial [marine metagenome]
MNFSRRSFLATTTLTTAAFAAEPFKRAGAPNLR